jgi:hypothetical protein
MSTTYVQFSPLGTNNEGQVVLEAPLTDAAGDGWSLVQADGYDETLFNELQTAENNNTSAAVELPTTDDSVALQVQSSPLDSSDGGLQAEVATYDDSGRLVSDFVLRGGLTSDVVTTGGGTAGVDTLHMEVSNFREALTTYDQNGDPTTSVTTYNSSPKVNDVATSSAAPSSSAVPAAAAAGDDWAQSPDTFIVIEPGSPAKGGTPLKNEDGSGIQSTTGPDINSPAPNTLLPVYDFNYEVTPVTGDETGGSEGEGGTEGETVTASFSQAADANSETLLRYASSGEEINSIELYQLEPGSGSAEVATDDLFKDVLIESETIHAGIEGDTRSYALESDGVEELQNDGTTTSRQQETTTGTITPPPAPPPPPEGSTPKPPTYLPAPPTTPPESEHYSATIVVGSGADAITAPLMSADASVGGDSSDSLMLTFNDPSADAAVISALQSSADHTIEIEIGKPSDDGASDTIFDTLKFETDKVLTPEENNPDGQTTFDYQISEIGGEDYTACYCPGSLILTDRGEVAVEALVIGDRLVTGSGEAKSLKWIGRRSYQGRFVAGNRRLLPVCVKAGAMGEGLPRRDLWVSPLHAMVVDGCLVPAGALVNGVSVLQSAASEVVRYIHLELAQHSIIYAEGAASESFVDDDSRSMFQNAHTFAELYPDARPTPAVYCLPRVEDGEELERLRALVDGHAGLTRQTAAPPALLGHLDRASGGWVEGWAQAEGHPEAPVCLDVMVDGVLAAQVLANRYRADLQAAGLGSGRHSFSVALDLAPRARVEVRRSLDGARLPQRKDLRAA